MHVQTHETATPPPPPTCTDIRTLTMQHTDLISIHRRRHKELSPLMNSGCSHVNVHWGFGGGGEVFHTTSSAELLSTYDNKKSSSDGKRKLHATFFFIIVTRISQYWVHSIKTLSVQKKSMWTKLWITFHCFFRHNSINDHLSKQTTF